MMPTAGPATSSSGVSPSRLPAQPGGGHGPVDRDHEEHVDDRRDGHRRELPHSSVRSRGSRRSTCACRVARRCMAEIDVQQDAEHERRARNPVGARRAAIRLRDPDAAGPARSCRRRARGGRSRSPAPRRWSRRGFRGASPQLRGEQQCDPDDWLTPVCSDEHRSEADTCRTSNPMPSSRARPMTIAMPPGLPSRFWTRLAEVAVAVTHRSVACDALNERGDRGDADQPRRRPAAPGWPARRPSQGDGYREHSATHGLGQGQRERHPKGRHRLQALRDSGTPPAKPFAPVDVALRMR